MLSLRPAIPDDLPILLHWDEQPHVLASDPHHDWPWEKELQYEPVWREQLMAEWNGRPIGFVQIIDPAEEESHYWGEVPANYRAIDIWIGEANDLGKGYGTQIMHEVIRRCFQDPKVEAILLDPLSTNTRAHRFYERLGFRFLEYRQFDEDHCSVYILTRENYSGVL